MGLYLIISTMKLNYKVFISSSRRVDALISSVPYLAAKITESQIHLLRPVFGEEGVFGVGQIATHASVTQQKKRSPSTPGPSNSESVATSMQLLPAAPEAKTGSLDVHLRNLHEDVVGELYQQFRAMYTHMFDPVLVRNGVAQFYDAIIVDRIQMRASRLLHENIQVNFGTSYVPIILSGDCI